MIQPHRRRAARTSLGVLICTLGLCALAPDLAAQQSPSEEQLAQFRAHLKTGGELLESKEYEEAIRSLDQARQIVDHPKISLRIADAYLASGQCDEASNEVDALGLRDDLKGDLQAELEDTRERLDVCLAASRQQQPTPVEKPPVTDADLQPAEVSDPGLESSSNWVNPVSWSLIGTGTALVLGGVITDVGSIARTEDLARAQRNDDLARVSQLEDDASSATTRAAVFYGLGAAMAAAGVVLQVVDLEPDQDPMATRRAPTLEAFLTPTGASARVRW